MKLIIAGSRTLPPLSNDFIGRYCPPEVEEIVSGMAAGPDMDGFRFGKEVIGQGTCFPANWEEHGRKAGALRNIEMAHYADQLLAFWDDKSRGTEHMIKYMKGLGKPVKVVLIKVVDNY